MFLYFLAEKFIEAFQFIFRHFFETQKASEAHCNRWFMQFLVVSRLNQNADSSVFSQNVSCYFFCACVTLRRRRHVKCIQVGQLYKKQYLIL